MDRARMSASRTKLRHPRRKSLAAQLAPLALEGRRGAAERQLTFVIAFGTGALHGTQQLPLAPQQVAIDERGDDSTAVRRDLLLTLGDGRDAELRDERLEALRHLLAHALQPLGRLEGVE